MQLSNKEKQELNTKFWLQNLTKYLHVDEVITLKCSLEEQSPTDRQ
jgi:hypothetical protein